LVGHHHPRVERRPALLYSAQHGPGGVITADLRETVCYLTLPVAIDDHHQIEHAGRCERLVGDVTLMQKRAQRIVDRIGVGVALGPVVLGHRRARAPDGVLIAAATFGLPRAADRPPRARPNRPDIPGSARWCPGAT